MTTSPLDGTQIRIAGSGSIWKAPAGTVTPTDSTSALGSAFRNLGYCTDGFDMKQNKKTQPITAWQTREIVRLITQSLDRSFAFELLQTNLDTLAAAWAATVTPAAGGLYTLDIDDGDDEFVLVIDWNDGATSQRIVVDRAAMLTLPDIKGGRQDAIRYPLEVQALKPADGSKSVKVYGVDTAVGGA